MKPVAIIATHPIQYQVPFYRYLAEQGVPLKVFFLCRRGLEQTFDPGFRRLVAWDIPLLEGFDYEFVPNLRREGKPERFLGLVNPALLTKLRRRNFSAVWVHGYRTLSMLGAILAARSIQLPVLFRADTNVLTSDPRRWKRFEMFPKLVAGCLSIGSLNDDFYDLLGMPGDRRFLVPYAVDNERFQSVSRTMTRREARKDLSLPQDKLIVLFAGKLVPWKRPDLLIRAFAKIDSPDTHLAIVGEGHLSEELRTLVERLVPGRVTFLGFLNQSEIGKAYKSANLLVLPSDHEPWGLVANEAMNFDIPVLASDRVGCTPDLIAQGETGSIFPHGNEAALASQLGHLLQDEDGLQRMGQGARRRIDEWSFSQGAEGVRTALQSLGTHET